MNHWSFVFFCCWKTQQVYNLTRWFLQYSERRKKITDFETAGTVSIVSWVYFGENCFFNCRRANCRKRKPSKIMVSFSWRKSSSDGVLVYFSFWDSNNGVNTFTYCWNSFFELRMMWVETKTVVVYFDRGCTTRIPMEVNDKYLHSFSIWTSGLHNKSVEGNADLLGFVAHG